MGRFMSPSSFCIILAVVIGIAKTVVGDTCYDVYCSSNEYCCGYNTCCFSFSSIWYAWLIIVLLILSISIRCCIRYQRRSAGVVVVQRPVVQPSRPATVIVNSQQVTSSNYGATQPPFQYPTHAQPGQQKYMDAPPAYQPYQGATGYQPQQQAYKDPSAPNY